MSESSHDDDVETLRIKTELVREIGRLIEERLPGDVTSADLIADRVQVAHLALGYQIAGVYEGHGLESGRNMVIHVVETMTDVMDQCVTTHTVS